MSKEILELNIEILHETDHAIMIENLNEENVWIPKSQIEISEDEKTIGIPEWLAKDKELI